MNNRCVRDLLWEPNIIFYWSTSEIRVRLVLSNMFKPSSNCFADCTKEALFCWSFTLCVFHVCLSYCPVCSLQPCGHMLTCRLHCLWSFFFFFFSFSHMVISVRCGIWLYWFLIFAFFYTLSYFCIHYLVTIDMVSLFTSTVAYKLTTQAHMWCHRIPQLYFFIYFYPEKYIQPLKLIKIPCKKTKTVID